VSLLGFCKGGRWRWGIEEEVDESLLIFDRESNELCFFDRLERGGLGGGNDEIADATALQFGGTFYDGQCFGSESRLDAGAAGLVFGHCFGLSIRLSSMYGILPDN
jgi:hypothetical protein